MAKHLFALFFLVALAGWATFAPPLAAAEREKEPLEIIGTCPMGRKYFLYLPKNLHPLRTYWLVVGVHGRHGDGAGASMVAAMVANNRCIVVGPSFPPGHKVLAQDSDQQLIGLFAELAKQYRLHPRMFVTGFSAGAQFTQRFTFRHPDLVIGCAPQSAGTWLTGDDNGGVAFDPALAERIPIGISCGLNDTGTAHRDEHAPPVLKPRIAWAKEFAALLAQHRFCYKAVFIPDVGHANGKHGGVPGECFDLSTTGMMPAERRAVDTLLAPLEQAFAAGQLDAARQAWTAIRPQLAELRQGWPEDPMAGEPSDGWHGNPQLTRELRRRTDAYFQELITEWDQSLQPGQQPNQAPEHAKPQDGSGTLR